MKRFAKYAGLAVLLCLCLLTLSAALTACDGGSTEDTTPEVTPEVTDAPTEAPTEKESETMTEPETTEAPTEEPTEAPTASKPEAPTEPAEKKGCGATVMTLSAVILIAASAVALKKKEN